MLGDVDVVENLRSEPAAGRFLLFYFFVTLPFKYMKIDECLSKNICVLGMVDD